MAPHNNTQLTISFELLYLMQWLLDHEAPRLKKLIKHALQKGLKEELQTSSKKKASSDDELQYSIVDFIELLETLLQESMTEHSSQQAAHHTLMPALKNIDNAVCGTDVVQSSIEKASLFLEDHPQANAQELLFKELLKTWKPGKKNMSH